MSTIAEVIAGTARWCVVTGDAREILPTIAAETVSAIVTDPVWPNAIDVLAGSEDPYGLLAETLAALPIGIKRLSLTLGCDSDPRILSAVPTVYPLFRVCWLRYARPHYKGRLLYGADVAYFFGSPPASRPGARVIPGEFCRTGYDVHVDHPCPRCTEHMDWLVEKWTEPGEMVCDPFCGSGTTGVACMQTGRRFIGIEIDPGYAAIARRRIAEAANHLFAGGAA